MKNFHSDYLQWHSHQYCFDGKGDPGTTFTWTIGSITGGITGASACASSCGTSIAQTLTNPGSAAGTVQYVVTPVSSLGCTGAPYNITVTVNPTPNAGQRLLHRPSAQQDQLVQLYQAQGSGINLCGHATIQEL